MIEQDRTVMTDSLIIVQVNAADQKLGRIECKRKGVWTKK
jgi:hypothetical protein